VSEAGFPRIPDDSRALLLRLARLSIREALLRDGCLERALEAMAITPEMRWERGVFVTLKVPDPKVRTPGGRLRGCIGTMTTEGPLYETVIRMARSSALEDPRFPPLGADELDELRISVSVLTPMIKLRDPDDLVLGRDGLQLTHGPHRSVFLPQVAEEQGWDRRRYLEQLALKAGLGRDAWRDAALSTFQAESFGESDPRQRSGT